MIKEGDKVKIKALNREKYMCSVLGWDDTMHELINNILLVYSVGDFQGVDCVVVIDEHDYRWYLFPEDVEILDDASTKVFDFMVNSLT